MLLRFPSAVCRSRVTYLGIYTVIHSFSYLLCLLAGFVCNSEKACTLFCSRCYAAMLHAFLYIIYLSKAFKVAETGGSEARLPPSTRGWLNGCNVYSCPFWPDCISCCMSIHPRHHCDSSYALLMDIHALPKLPWSYTYCILLLRWSDELTWPWYYCGRYSIGEWAKWL